MGAGNLGTLIYAEIKHRTDNQVFLMTSKREKFADKIDVYAYEDYLYSVDCDSVVDEFVHDADIVFLTYPKNIMIQMLPSLIEKAKQNSVFIFVPGTGGVEFYFADARKKNISFIGLQRVPYISRLIEYGHAVNKLSTKSNINAAVLGNAKTDVLFELLGINTIEEKNFLSVTFTPSNPILHTSRLYGMLAEKDIKHVYERQIYFYYEWDNFSSEVLSKANAELMQVCQKLKNEGVENLHVVSLMEHYESKTTEELTKKIVSIKSFKDIFTPMVKVQNGYIFDMDSRYIQEDFSYGLMLLKAFAEICDIATPMFDTILNWYGKITNQQVLIDGKINRKIFKHLPQTFGISTIEEIKNFYNTWR